MRKIMFAMIRTLGDVVLGTTLVHELKREYLDSEIHWFVNKSYAPILGNNPDITALHVSEDWKHDMLFMEFSTERYDEVFLPYQSRPECNMWHQDEETRHQHLVDFYWRRMGFHRLITERECYIYPSAKDHRHAAEDHISLDVPRVAIHSTTGVETKDWPYFGDLVEQLRKLGYGCVQVGALSDKEISGAVDFRGKMGLLELAAFLSKCAVFVGLDSGISYMADAMHVPSVIIQGSTSPVTSGPISGRPIRLFAKGTGFSDCEDPRCHVNCRHETNCNTRITVDMVIEAMDPLLEGWTPPIPAGV